MYLFAQLWKTLKQLFNFRFIKKPKIKMTKQTSFFVGTPLRLANKLMLSLYPDDSFFASAKYSLVRPEDARKLFIYGAARLVAKAATTLLVDAEFIQDGTPKQENTQSRLIVEAHLDNQRLWERKLSELLVDVINFENDDQPLAYRIFLTAENLNLFMGKQWDITDFFGKRSENVNHSVEGFRQRIKKDLRELGTIPIFLNDKNFKSGRLPVFSNVRGRYKNALLLASDEERIALGMSYHSSYSLSSLSVHATVSSYPHKQNFDSVENNMWSISILGQHILNRLYRMVPLEDKQTLDNIFASGTSGAPMIVERFKRVGKTGDIVLAAGHLAEIIEVYTSKFGYTSFKVKFLSAPLIAGMDEDWMMSENIRILVRKESAKQWLRDNTAAAKNFPYKDLIFKQPDSVIYENVKALLTDLANRGVLNRIIRLGDNERNNLS